MRALVLLAVLALALPARADWPHYLGPQFDNVSLEKEISAGSVNKLWSAEVGTGFASVTISGGRAYTMGNDGAQDQVIALDADSGAPVWRHSYPAPIEARSYEGGPNATPTVSGGRVYALGRQGRMLCLDAATGAVVWDKSSAPFNAEPPTWGFSGAPTVVGEAVVYNCGSRGIALHKDTGATLWGTGGSGAGYATAVPYASGGVKDSGVALFNSAGLHALDIRTGAPVWSFDWNTSFEVNAASPTPVGNGFFISTGYDTGCALVDVSGPQPREVWRNRAMCSHFTTSAYRDGFLYGVDGNAGRRCNLVCLNAADGAVVWKKETGFGTLRLVEDKLFFLSEPGMLFVVKASPKAYQELGKHRVINGKCWTAPTIAHKKVYVRNATGTLNCHLLEGGALTVEPLPVDRDVNLSY